MVTDLSLVKYSQVFFKEQLMTGCAQIPFEFCVCILPHVCISMARVEMF